MKWLTMIILALLILFFWRYCGQEMNKENTVITESSTETTTTPEIMDTVSSSANFETEDVGAYIKELSSGFKLSGNADGIENKLLSFIESDTAIDKTTWFNFDRLTFRTGSAEIDMEKSVDQLTNMMEILKEYPNVVLKIGGYTDNTGTDEVNRRISQQRAEAVAATLAHMGINGERLDPEGYGSQHPVASNDTEEGRAMNRRIAVRVKAK